MYLAARKYTMLDMFGLSFRASPLYSALTALRRLIWALLPTFNIFVTAAFVNTALDILGGRSPSRAIYGPIGLILAITAFNVLSGVAGEFITSRWIIVLRRRLRPLIVKKVANLEYRHIEDSKTADLISRVAPTFDTQVQEMFNYAMWAVEIIVFAAGILVTLVTQVWWAGIFIFAAGAVTLVFAVRAGKRSYDADRKVTKIDRFVNYISGVMKNRDAVEERTMYGYTEELNKRYSEQYSFARKLRLKVHLSNTVNINLGRVICSLVAIFTMLALLGSAAKGTVSYGMFIGLAGAVLNLSGRLDSFNWVMHFISRNREYLKDFSEFLALSETPDAVCLPESGMNFRRIEFRDVRFSYPGTDRLILNGVSFVIEYGRHYSFVGINGAGKTTITKLLTGLYTNYEGEIFVDGRELRTLNQAEIKALSSVVYQDFARYFLSLYENIAIAVPEAPESEKRKMVEDAVSLTGLSEAVEKLKNGMDTPLGKVHADGVDLSGGEWQRLAMARSVVSQRALRILDEPTAALDPVSESRVYHQFEKISQGQTTVLISHRLGSTKLADVIYVLSEGKIAETGSHAGLMAHDGLYAEMFRAQAEWYAREASSMEGEEA